ncbi:hypothetical protein I547_4447 [Mycobacterium kansasii 824]|uniref:Uncharacterized protein n=1 Tax=Mycobacterium kansasii TaxID=1768 RepID=A0A1V3WAE2_MYCKA|nr:hypothetical protein I547_4447 [Mycobacterium kansasii 824]OOK63910.1 hypothetical protein BZL29_8422 [Mycobacterium kansasii]OOK71846.1 hypothetical protein BZL30_5314 [Mycobacterium kansasii]
MLPPHAASPGRIGEVTVPAPLLRDVRDIDAGRCNRWNWPRQR